MKLIGIMSIFLLVACSTKATSASDAKPETKPATAQASGSASSAAATSSKTTKPAAAVAETGSGGEGKTTCMGGEDSRVLEITKEGEGCKLTYTKAGNTSNPANAKNGTKFCEDVKAKIQAKLEQSGFKCN